MTFILTIKTDNAAFGPVDEQDDAEVARGYETARILRELADCLTCGDTRGTVQDANGNTVGEFKFS